LELIVIIQRLLKVSRSLRLSNGLYIASSGNKDYKYVWWRDCFYQALPELYFDKNKYKQTWHKLLDCLHDLESKYQKFSSMIESPSQDTWRYLHARMDLDGNEIQTGWSDKQNDIIGEIFMGIYLGEINNIQIIRDEKDIDIINLLVEYLQAIRFWETFDHGMWEQDEAVRSSSIGICISGLHRLFKLSNKFPNLNKSLILELSEIALKKFYTIQCQETSTRKYDLAKLALIYPFSHPFFDLTNDINCEDLIRYNGMIRYHNDCYNQTNLGEAEWTMGFLYKGFCCLEDNDIDGAKYWLNLILLKCQDGNIPEAYFAETQIPINNPLGWSVSLAILLILDIQNDFTIRERMI